MLDIWWVQIIIYLLAVVSYTQFFKAATKKSKKDGALTVTLEVITSIIMLAFIPFFEIKWATDIKVYLFTALAVIFYCMKDRMTTTVRRHLDTSTVNILDQIVNVFMILWGILFFKEEVIFKKIIGAILIILSNVMIFYKKGNFKLDRYVLLSILSNLALSIALALNVDNSEKFNVAIYQVVTLMIPAILIIIFEKIKWDDIKNEVKEGNKTAILMTGISWAVMIISQLRAYQTGDITTVAPLSAVSVILNVIAGYFISKEKENIVKKIIAGVIIVFSIFLIKG
ncbi:MAG TPA: DMT family transporter [Candidatus Merdicola faecigallinarum]|uniref:DMT family transporter n=1 Tax=Candidatus Merdicola faecigallinarum TaxID=2840862 RepID=A0A9D1S986_9FIRM|nr:DMT family transporter [Candidatus Merdicola faecigallinarum]